MPKKNNTQPQVGWRIDRELKRWLDIEAAKRGLRPARVIEDCIRLMQEDEASHVAD